MGLLWVQAATFSSWDSRNYQNAQLHTSTPSSHGNSKNSVSGTTESFGRSKTSWHRLARTPETSYGHTWTSRGASATGANVCPRSVRGATRCFSDFLYLNRREAAICRRMRNSAFCWYDSLVEPYVLWHYGLNWHDISCMEEDGKLPLKHVRRLLERVLHDPRPAARRHGRFRHRHREVQGLAAEVLAQEAAVGMALQDGIELGRGVGVRNMRGKVPLFVPFRQP